MKVKIFIFLLLASRCFATSYSLDCPKNTFLRFYCYDDEFCKDGCETIDPKQVSFGSNPNYCLGPLSTCVMHFPTLRIDKEFRGMKYSTWTNYKSIPVGPRIDGKRPCVIWCSHTR